MPDSLYLWPKIQARIQSGPLGAELAPYVALLRSQGYLSLAQVESVLPAAPMTLPSTGEIVRSFSFLLAWGCGHRKSPDCASTMWIGARAS